jgi:hypothetical protein
MANPLINGVNYSWSNVKLVLFGVPVIGITQIEYKRKQTKENNYGMGTEPISRGYGNKEYEGKITLYREEWNSIIAAAPSRDPLEIAPFDIQVSFSGSRVLPALDVLRACEFLEDPFTIAQGDTKAMVEIPLIIGLIDHVS